MFGGDEGAGGGEGFGGGFGVDVCEEEVSWICFFALIFGVLGWAEKKRMNVHGRDSWYAGGTAILSICFAFDGMVVW